jgi:hypothetical protein
MNTKNSIQAKILWQILPRLKQKNQLGFLALVFRMEFLAQVDSFPVFGTYFLMMN